MRSLFAALLTGMLLVPTALASEADAESCLRTKLWDGYSDGWAIRTLTSSTVKQNSTRNYLVTLYKGNEYQLSACGDEKLENLDLLLYDLDGNVVLKDSTVDREPLLTLKPDQTTTYYIVVHARQVKKSAKQAGVAVAVAYR